MSGKRTVSGVALLLAVHSIACAATLKPETKQAWEEYLRQANASMQSRLQPTAHFLWLDEESGRREHVHTAGPLVGPIDSQVPRKIPSGLIHHWLGAGFVPDAKIEDILNVVRDYGHYKDIYRPGVLDSISHGESGAKDLFFMRLANKSVVSKTALDTECEASYIRIDDKRWYGYSNTISIREIDKFGTASERTLPEDQGTGLIWRLSSITRLEERDGGVYAELEAIALSRDIPVAFRFFVTPIVRRVSRDSLTASLHQTKVAVDSLMARQKKGAVLAQ